jgi:hypothetical protein
LWSTIVRSTPLGSLIVSSSSRLEVTVDVGKAAATARTNSSVNARGVSVSA